MTKNNLQKAQLGGRPTTIAFVKGYLNILFNIPTQPFPDEYEVRDLTFKKKNNFLKFMPVASKHNLTIHFVIFSYLYALPCLCVEDGIFSKQFFISYFRKHPMVTPCGQWSTTAFVAEIWTQLFSTQRRFQCSQILWPTWNPIWTIATENCPIRSRCKYCKNIDSLETIKIRTNRSCSICSDVVMPPSRITRSDDGRRKILCGSKYVLEKHP